MKAKSEKNRERNIPYIYTYIRSINQSINQQRKVQTCISVDESVRDAVKFLAPFFNTTASDLYAIGALEKLEALIPQLPESIQVSIMHQINVKQEVDPEIMGLKIDILHEQMRFWIERVKMNPKNAWAKDHLKKQLKETMKAAARSGNDALKQLVIEARELLRGSLT